MKTHLKGHSNDVLLLSDIADMFGTAESLLSDKVKSLYDTQNWNYEAITGQERELIILDLLKFIEIDNQIIGSPSRQAVWYNGWKENLDSFKIHGDINRLVPIFIRNGQTVRLHKQFIRPFSQFFELNFFRIFQMWLFSTFMEEYDSIYEFGCGSGINLEVIARIMHNKKLYGCDFVQTSVDLVDSIAERFAYNMKGVLFDMTVPDDSLKIDNNSCIFTIGSVEQLSGNFQKFVEYLIREKPRLCIHMEPTIELYDKSSLVDYTAIMFHKKRGYTTGFLPYLQQLQNSKRIEIIAYKRMCFGSIRMEGYNYIIWRPVG